MCLRLTSAERLTAEEKDAFKLSESSCLCLRNMAGIKEVNEAGQSHITITRTEAGDALASLPKALAGNRIRTRGGTIYRGLLSSRRILRI